MIRFAALLLVLAAVPAQGTLAAQQREFDFWIGEWAVLHRTLGGDAGWRDAGGAKARIRPILGGKASRWAARALLDSVPEFPILVGGFDGRRPHAAAAGASSGGGEAWAPTLEVELANVRRK